MIGGIIRAYHARLETKMDDFSMLCQIFVVAIRVVLVAISLFISTRSIHSILPTTTQQANLRTIQKTQLQVQLLLTARQRRDEQF